jgi:ABC-2 type transport system permease protein
MKIIAILSKSLKEQIRSYWVLLLSLSMGPFFIFIYFLITESSKPQYQVMFENEDQGVLSDGVRVNRGDSLIAYFMQVKTDSVAFPIRVRTVSDHSEGIAALKNKKADALIVITGSFSKDLECRRLHDSTAIPEVNFFGDLTNANYLISAIWINEIIHEYAMQATHNIRVVSIKETALGSSASMGYFDMMVPGLLILSLIMLMFTASIAFVSEVENKTIMRLKLSGLTAFEFLAGITIVQLMVGIVSVLLTLLTAILLGFHFSGSIITLIAIATLTSLSIIAFSLIIAALTKSATEVLVVGNFPMFLFMFFTGAAFPMKSEPWFTVAGYPINIQGLMTPTHAISVLNKTFVLNMNISSIFPEILSIIMLTIVYFLIGGILFRRRHLKLA